MKQALKYLRVFLLIAGTFGACASQAQQRLLIPVPLAPPPTSAELAAEYPSVQQPEPEPERWTKEDLTLDEQFSTAKKEAMAAYQIALDQCKLELIELQPACIAQAKGEMETEMSLIKARFGITN